MHQDYARYFESSLNCANLLFGMKEGIYNAAVMKDIVEPAIAVAFAQMESIRKEVARYAAAKRKMEYDAVSSLRQTTRSPGRSRSPTQRPPEPRSWTRPTRRS